MNEVLKGLKVKIFADGADLESLLALAENPWITGFTTNPTLMRKAGLTDYPGFAREVLRNITEPADLVRGVRRRPADDPRPGARDRLVGPERLRQDPRSRPPPGSPRPR